MITPDEDRTISKDAPPPTGRSGRLDEPANALPSGTRLAEFEIRSVIGEGGFGIVYLAQDLSLGREVAIKEYMPAALAARTKALTVSVRSERHAETFATGLRSFINEARLLAQFDHPSLLKVYRFWEAHGTAYMAMPYYAGITLAATLKQLPGGPDEEWLKRLLTQLLDALEQMHAAHCYHRDIAPDNVLIQPDGRALLLDFGAARRVIGDMTRALTVILKTGYAPVEQYGEMPDFKQGPWTDLYALASVAHYAITGSTPPPAIQRFLNDKYEPLSRVAAGRYSLPFLQALDQALAVLPKDRPQSAAALRALLNAQAGPQAVAAVPAAAKPDVALGAEPLRAEAPRSAPRPARPGAEAPDRSGLALAAIAAVLLACAGGGAYLLLHAGDVPVATATQATVTPAPPQATTVPPPPAPEASTAATTAAPLEAAAGQQPTASAPLDFPAPHIVAKVPASPKAERRSGINTSTSSSSQSGPTASRRCADIIQHVSLGEPLTPEDRDFLKQECGR